MYDRDALLKLARNFADPEVGCVTGEARYLSGGRNAADVGERVYWDYEIQIKRLETALGSMVGGDGAIYAIRRPLWRELPSNAINDFLNPVTDRRGRLARRVRAGGRLLRRNRRRHRAREYRRRVRIVSRSWRAVFQARRRAQPAARGPVHLVAGLTQVAALAVGRLRRPGDDLVSGSGGAIRGASAVGAGEPHRGGSGGARADLARAPADGHGRLLRRHLRGVDCGGSQRFVRTGVGRLDDASPGTRPPRPTALARWCRSAC